MIQQLGLMFLGGPLDLRQKVTVLEISLLKGLIP